MPRRYLSLYQCEHQNWEAWPRLLLRQVARPSDRPWRPAAQSGAGHTGLYQIGGGGSRCPLRRRQWPFHKAGAVGPGGGQRSAATLGGVSQYGLQRLRLQHTRGVHTEGRGEELAQPVLKASRQSSNTKKCSLLFLWSAVHAIMYFSDSCSLLRFLFLFIGIPKSAWEAKI